MVEQGLEYTKSEKQPKKGLLVRAAAAGSIALAMAGGLSACGENASAESGQSGTSTTSSTEASSNVVCNTETGTKVTKKDGMDPNVFKEASVCDTMTPKPTVEVTPVPSKTESQDTSWIPAEYLKKANIDYSLFDNWDSQDDLTKLINCAAFFKANGVTVTTASELTGASSPLTPQQIVDRWDAEQAVVWSVNNDRSNEKNPQIAQDAFSCITSSELSYSDGAMKNTWVSGLSYAAESNLTLPPEYKLGKVESATNVFQIITDKDIKNIQAWHGIVINVNATHITQLGNSEEKVQLVFKESTLSNYGDEAAGYQLLAAKNITDTNSEDLAFDLGSNHANITFTPVD